MRRSESTLNDWMMVEKYPNLKEEVGGWVPGYEISSLLDKILSGGQLPHVLLPPKKSKIKSKSKLMLRLLY